MEENKFSKKSTTISIRIPNDLLEDIDELSEFEEVDRPTWIKRALLSFASDVRSEIEDNAISDYINLRIDDKEFLKYVEFKKIPKDIQDARKEILDLLVLKRKKEVNKK